MADDKTAAFKLLETGTLIDFQVLKTDKQASPDGNILYLRVELAFVALDDGEPEEIAEWGSFGFIYALAMLSFADARPRGYSGKEFAEDDEFTVADLIDCLRFIRGELHFDADYIRGRAMKTEITIRQDGTVILETRARGEAALRWLDRLKGKKHIRLAGE